MDIRIVRIFNTYGPRCDPEDGRLIPNFVTQALTGQPITVYGDGSQTRSLCYVSDLVDGIFRMMIAEEASGEVINLGNPQEQTVLEYAGIIRDLCHSDSEIVREPLRTPDDPNRRQPDISKARSVLRWEPRVGLDAGLRQTIEWYRSALADKGSPTGKQ
jgi:nucleoside-diphosphate-sugar epimerase